MYSTEEFMAVKKWLDESFGDGQKKGQLPFSFTYAGKKSADMLPKWKFDVKKKKTGLKEFRWLDPATNLECRCEMTVSSDFPAVEWVVRFENKGQKDTPIIEDVLSLNLQ